MNSPASLDGIAASASSLELALSGAELSSSKIIFICNSLETGIIHRLVGDWLHEGAEHNAKFLLMDRNQVADVILMHPKLTRVFLANRIRIKDINEFLIIGKEVCAFDVKGQLYIHRDSAFIKKANQIVRSLQKIITLLELKESKLKLKRKEHA